MTQSRHTIQLCLLLARWLVSFLPHMAVGQTIKPAFIIECDNPDVTAEVTNTNTLKGYLPAGMEITKATWKQGENEEKEITGIFTYTPAGEKDYFSNETQIDLTGTGIVTIKLTVSPKTDAKYKLSINKSDAIITINGTALTNLTALDTTFSVGTTLTIKAEGGGESGKDSLTAASLSGYSTDRKLIFASQASTDDNDKTPIDPVVTFTMPASDVSVFVSTRRNISLPAAGVDPNETKRELQITYYNETCAEGVLIIDDGVKQLDILKQTTNVPKGINILPVKILLYRYLEKVVIPEPNPEAIETITPPCASPCPIRREWRR